jgi:1-acyl-sn-glycerol-3-phosphate acyltransferase
MPLYRFKKSKDSDKLPKPPFIIVSNHGTFFDPWIIGYFSYYPFAIMCNDEAFTRGAVTRWYLNSIGAFPKKKGASDFKAMKKTIHYLNNKYPVCIFPEGQTSWNGETQLIYKGIEKIIKKTGVSLVLTRICGNFLTKPWWADYKRKGKITVTYKTITSQEIKNLSEQEIFDLIKNFIYHNDIKTHLNKQNDFKGKNLAEGLERYIWICMNCESEDTLKTVSNQIICTSCQSKWNIDALCRIKPLKENIKSFNDLYDLSIWHKTKVLEKINKSNNSQILTKSINVLMQKGDTNIVFHDIGIGNMELTLKTLTFYNINFPLINYSFNVDKLETIVIQKKDILEFLYDGKYYRFSFNRKSPMKWIYYLRYLKGYEKFEEQGYIE